MIALKKFLHPEVFVLATIHPICGEFREHRWIMQQIKKALLEVKRVLLNNGEFLFSFHVGNEIVTLNNFLNKKVNIQFQFFEVDKIKKIIEEVGFEIMDITKREAYKSEHPTERA